VGIADISELILHVAARSHLLSLQNKIVTFDIAVNKQIVMNFLSVNGFGWSICRPAVSCILFPESVLIIYNIENSYMAISYTFLKSNIKWNLMAFVDCHCKT
jgi:hypothetical protein